MSQWLFDLGNTRLKYAPFDGQGVGPVAVWAHQDQQRPLPEPAQLPAGSTAGWPVWRTGLARAAAATPAAAF